MNNVTDIPAVAIPSINTQAKPTAKISGFNERWFLFIVGGGDPDKTTIKN
jgi:hypothetical protein